MSMFLSMFFTLSLNTQAALVQSEIEYKEGSTKLTGFLVYDDSVKSKAPGVMVVHNWMGISDETKDKAQQLAQMGYVVFAADIYGTGVRPKDSNEAGQFAGKYKSDRKLFRARLNAALEVLKKQKNVDSSKLAAIGYCFGGTGVIELARSGAKLNGVVSFHGGLDSPNPQDGKNIKSRVLALHGADDPYVPAKDLEAFEAEMRSNKIDWQLIKYGGAVHSFTDKGAGNDNSKGAAYNASADKRSWEAMKVFFSEIF